MGKEQGTGPQVSRVKMAEGKGEVEGISSGFLTFRKTITCKGNARHCVL